MTGNEKTKSFLQSIGTSFEQFSKVTVALGAVVYVLGLIVLNVHLSQYGIFSPSLLQLNYIIAGLWALSPVALVALLGFAIIYAFVAPYLFRSATANKPRGWIDQVTTFLAGFVIWLILAVAFFYLYWSPLAYVSRVNTLHCP